MSLPLVIYHDNCADGFGAAFCFWLKFGDNAEYLPASYGKEMKINFKGRDVHIVDFSFPKDVMNTIFIHAKSVVWLDHHKTAFEMWCGGIPTNERFYDISTMRGVHMMLDNNKSGAMLAWEYMFGNEPAPILIRHIDDYDRWQFKIKHTKEFIAAIRAVAPWNFEQWREMLLESSLPRNLQEMYKTGKTILYSHEQQINEVIERGAMPCKLVIKTARSGWTGEHGFALNCPPNMTSDAGHKLAKKCGSYGLLWRVVSGNKVECGLRSEGDYDVSEIAKHFGGGGHKNAAGFTLPLAEFFTILCGEQP